MNSIDFEPGFITELNKAGKIVFFTGAGISAESGIPTFRGKDGIWNKLKPEELANFSAFLKNPDMVWEWYQYRRKIISETKPNAGHIAIAALESIYDVTVVTQNVDNLHRRAGSKKIYELHGNIEKNYCINCKKRYDYEKFSYEKPAPKCGCGGLIRPDVVWFGEFLPQDQYSTGEKAAKNCDIMFVVGTSAVVYPAAYIPLAARENNKCVVEVNLERTELSRFADYSFYGKAGEILPLIEKKAKELKGTNV
jgi:NAD-dependent deacetylase